MEETPHNRHFALLLIFGFILLTIGAALGAEPSWPSRIAWSVVAGGATLSLIGYFVKPSTSLLRFSTVCIYICATARAAGFILDDDQSTANRISWIGVWSAVLALTAIRHKYRRL